MTLLASENGSWRGSTAFSTLGGSTAACFSEVTCVPPGRSLLSTTLASLCVLSGLLFGRFEAAIGGFPLPCLRTALHCRCDLSKLLMKDASLFGARERHRSSLRRSSDDNPSSSPFPVFPPLPWLTLDPLSRVLVIVNGNTSILLTGRVRPPTLGSDREGPAAPGFRFDILLPRTVPAPWLPALLLGLVHHPAMVRFSTVTALVLLLASFAAAQDPPATTKPGKEQAAVADVRKCGSSEAVFDDVEEKVYVPFCLRFGHWG